MGFRLRCTDCRGKFPWMADSKFPKCCPLCGANFGSDRPDDDVVMPFIRSNKTTATDKVYRDMEAGSEFRAEKAAEMAGVPVSEMSGLKITNMNDRRDRTDSAIDVVNPVSQMMERPEAQGRVGFGVQNAVELSGASMSGPFPSMGARMRTAIQGNHAETVRSSIQGIGDGGKVVAPSSDVVSDVPANETRQPGYRRRG